LWWWSSDVVLGPAVPLVNLVVVVFRCGSAALLLLIAKPLLFHEFFAVEFTTFEMLYSNMYLFCLSKDKFFAYIFVFVICSCLHLNVHDIPVPCYPKAHVVRAQVFPMFISTA
jgi:hypothetical protein